MRLFLLMASLLGLVVSLVGHIAILLGVETPVRAVNSLLALGVILWLGSGFEAYLLRRELREGGSSVLFQGAPPVDQVAKLGSSRLFCPQFFPHNRAPSRESDTRGS